jgi:hypothetical protein
MRKAINPAILTFLILMIFSACEKDDEGQPTAKPLPIDTLTADQYIYCTIDTIQFWASTTGGGPDKIVMAENSDVLTRFLFETDITRTVGVPLKRNIELHLYDFKDRRVGTYTGSKIFAKSRTDISVNNVDAEDKYWEMVNVISNRIQVTQADSNMAKGNFSLKMRSVNDPNQFIEIRNGIFKIKTR